MKVFSAVALTKIDVYRLLMIEFLNIQSAFEHYKRVLGGNDPVETRAKYHDDRLYAEHYHAYTGQSIIGALFKKGTRRDPDFSLACCLDHHDASATQLTDKIPRVRPRKHNDQVDSTAQFLDWFKRSFPNQGICEYYRQLALEAVQRRKPQSAPSNPAPGSREWLVAQSQTA